MDEIEIQNQAEKLFSDLNSSLRLEDGDRISYGVDKICELQKLIAQPKWIEIINSLSIAGYATESDCLVDLFTKDEKFEGFSQFKLKITEQNFLTLLARGQKVYQNALQVSKKFIEDKVKKPDTKTDDDQLLKVKKKIQGVLKEALIEFQNALALKPNSVECLEFIAKIYLDLGNKEESEKFLNEKLQYLKIQNEENEKRELEELEKARIDQENLLKSEEDEGKKLAEKIEELNFKGEESLASQNFRSALVCFTEVLALDKKNTKAMIGKLKGLLGLKDYQIALTTADFYLRMGGNETISRLKNQIQNEEFVEKKSNAVLRLQKTISKGNGALKSEYSKSQEEFTSLFEKYPKDLDLIDGIYSCFCLMGDHPQAAMMLKRAQGIKPDFQSKFMKSATSKCYVASFLFGPTSPEVGSLRIFRDTFLKRSLIGRGLIQAYYLFCPWFISKCGEYPPMGNFLKFFIKRLLWWLNHFFPKFVNPPDKQVDTFDNPTDTPPWINFSRKDKFGSGPPFE